MPLITARTQRLANNLWGFLSAYPNGLNTKRLAQKTGYSEGVTRRLLKYLKDTNRVDWRPLWYGKLEGYTRIYTCKVAR